MILCDKFSAILESDNKSAIAKSRTESLNLAPNMAPSTQKETVLKIIERKTDEEVQNIVTTNPVAQT